MTGYVARRIFQMIPVVLTIIVFNFILIHLAPADPAVIIAGERGTAEYVEAIRKAWGLDRPLHDQFAIYLAKVLQGDLGYSYTFQRPVLELITERTPTTLLLVIPSQLLSLALGTLIGALCAKKHGSRSDSLISLSSIALYSVPVFWLGLILVILFGIFLPLFPIWGFISTDVELSGWAYVADMVWHLFLPVLTLSGAYLPRYIRLARSSVMEVMMEDFVTTARAKGLTENSVFFKHALRNALLPTITQAGLLLGFVLAGAIVTESVFGWPGLGRLMYTSILARDYPMLMGLFLVTSVCVVIASLVTDIAYAFLDPRVVYR